MSSLNSKKPGAEDEHGRRPDVIPGDEVFFNHPTGALSGRVTACGAHGATIKCGKIEHKIKWPHILGHKKRQAQGYQIEDSGEDGHIVVDSAGKRRYLAVPNEAHEDPLVVKAEKPGTPFGGKPGLQKKVITEKTGKQNTHWVKTGKELPKGKPGKAPAGATAEKPHPNAKKPGERVKFKAGDFQGEGTVDGNPGKDGAYVKDKSGRKHQVKWDEMEGGKPNYPAREEGETDKAYAKRAVDTQDAPKHLPEEHDKYFNTEGSSTVPLDKLHSSKTEEENQQGGDNSPKRMEAAYHGVLGKRDPITVAPHPDKPGHFKVLDGNGTVTGAKKAGWKNMPVKVMEEGDFNKQEAEKEAKKLATKVVDPKAPQFADLPRKAAQPTADKDSLLKLSEAGLEQLRDWLNRGTGVASQLGFTSMTKPPEDVTDAEYEKPGKMLFIAPVKHGSPKGLARTIEKVDKDYDGDWSKLSDLVRCTLAVDDLHEMADVLASLEKSGMQVAQTPKNTFLQRTDMGYCDVNLIVTMKNGVQAEVQLNVKDMIRAKNEAHPHYEVTRKLKGKYEKTKTAPATPIADWAPEDQQSYTAAANEQQKIYDKGWFDHVVKHYAGNAPKMVKSLQRLLLIFGTAHVH